MAQPSSQVGCADRRAPFLRRSSSEDSAGKRLEEIEQHVRQLLPVREQAAVDAVAHALGQAGAVVQREHRHAGAEQVGDLHRDVDPRRGAMKAEAEVGAADDPRVVLGLEPARAKLDPARRQAGEPAFELGAPGAIARDEHDEIREPPLVSPASQSRMRSSRWRAASMTRSKSSSAVQPVGQTMNPSVAVLRMPRRDEERLAYLFAFEPLDRREGRRRPVVEHAHRVLGAVPQLEAFGEKPREPPRDAQVRVRAPRERASPASARAARRSGGGPA